MASTQELKYVVQYVATPALFTFRGPRVSSTAERPDGIRLLWQSRSPMKPIAEDKIGQEHFYQYSLSQY